MALAAQDRPAIISWGQLLGSETPTWADRGGSTEDGMLAASIDQISRLYHDDTAKVLLPTRLSVHQAKYLAYLKVPYGRFTTYLTSYYLSSWLCMFRAVIQPSRGYRLLQLFYMYSINFLRHFHACQLMLRALATLSVTRLDAPTHFPTICRLGRSISVGCLMSMYGIGGNYQT